MTPVRKRLAILFVVVGIGLIVARAMASGADVVAPLETSRSPADPLAAAPAVAGTAANRQGGGPPPVLRLDDLAKRVLAKSSPPSADAVPLFAAQSWQPPTPAAPAAEPIEPVAPPFPYAYLGGISDETGRTVFFSHGDRVLPIRGGDIVDGTYRVEHLDDLSMTLTYLPLQKTVQVALGGGR